MFPPVGASHSAEDLISPQSAVAVGKTIAEVFDQIPFATFVNAPESGSGA